MLNLTSTLQQAINDGLLCRYVKITLADATVFAITDHDVPFTFESVVYTPAGNLNSIRMIQTSNTQVSVQTIFCTWLSGVIDEASFKVGLYDDADVEVGLLAWALSPKERMVVFSGKIGELTYNDTGMSIEALDDMKLLERNYGRLYTTQDPFTFDDPQFGLTESAWRNVGQIDYVLTNRFKFRCTGDATFLSKPSNWYTYGKIVFTSGSNNGWAGQVKIHEVNANPNIGISIEMLIPTPYVTQVGDTFTVVAGYDGSFEQSRDKFSNYINFGGFPHIKPLQEIQ